MDPRPYGQKRWAHIPSRSHNKTGKRNGKDKGTKKEKEDGMKKILLLTLAAAFYCGCGKDNPASPINNYTIIQNTDSIYFVFYSQLHTGPGGAFQSLFQFKPQPNSAYPLGYVQGSRDSLFKDTVLTAKIDSLWLEWGTENIRVKQYSFNMNLSTYPCFVYYRIPFIIDKID
jgi:hypothetical protein